MSNIALPNKYSYLNAAQEVAAICHPLLNSLGIHFFCYMRYFNDNTCYVLTTNKDFFEYIPITPRFTELRFNDLEIIRQ